MQTGIVHSIETFGTLDGPGTRYVLFLKGCPLRCIFCHNPDTWKMEGGMEKTTGEILEDVLRTRSFYKKGGVTISGGEPMLQHDFVKELLTLFRENNIHTALDTAGSIEIEKSAELIDLADMLLLDMKAPTAEMFETITGSPMKNSLDTLDYCEKTNKRVWIRHVVVPGYTDSDEDAESLGKLLADYKCIEYVDLLPFHKLGEYKWKELGIPYTLYDVSEPDPSRMEKHIGILGRYGLKARYNH